MVAAAVLMARWVWDATLIAAQWIATRAFILAILAIGLPWVLKGVLVYAWNWFAEYGRGVATFFMDTISGYTSSAGLDIDIQLTGVGGYIASQVGLVDYASIIFTGWGLYWLVAVLAKSQRMMRL
jgi:hypothetical protein